MPAARTASATPATSGASGPTTTRSAPSDRASAGDRGAVQLVDRVQLREQADARVARGRVQLGHRGVEGERAHEGVLTGAGADDEDLHGRRAYRSGHEVSAKPAIHAAVPRTTPTPSRAGALSALEQPSPRRRPVRPAAVADRLTLACGGRRVRGSRHPALARPLHRRPTRRRDGSRSGRSGGRKRPDPSWALAIGDEVVGQIGLRHLDHADGHTSVSYWVLPTTPPRGVASAALSTLATVVV